jgi:hypothetical protein
LRRFMRRGVPDTYCICVTLIDYRTLSICPASGRGRSSVRFPSIRAEADICHAFVVPKLVEAGLDSAPFTIGHPHHQCRTAPVMLEQVFFSGGK